jgi:uncharacterized DUF497 family protein
MKPRPCSTTFPDTGHSRLVEPRFLTIGMSSRGRLLVVAHTEHNDTVRIIRKPMFQRGAANRALQRAGKLRPPA